MEEKKQLVCGFCGGYFQEMLAKCPYCGSTNIKGAEAEYMEKLEAVRTDMEELAVVPAQETKKAVKKVGKFIVITGGIIAVILLVIVLANYFMFKAPLEDRDPKADYEWEVQNFPIWDALYEQGKDMELADSYIAAVLEDAPVYHWEHYEYASAMFNFSQVEDMWERERKGYELDDWEHAKLLYMMFRVDEYEESSAYTVEEKERMAPYIEKVRADAETRWNFTEEEWVEVKDAILTGSDGSANPMNAEKFMKKYLKEKK